MSRRAIGGSASKAFTVFALGALVDEGKLGWDKPLEHWHYDTFSGLRAEDPVFENSQLNFISDANENIARLEVPFEAKRQEE